MTSRLSQVCVEVDRYAPQSQLAAIYSPSGHFNTFTGTFDHVDAPVAAQLSPVQQAEGGYSTQFAVVPQTFVKGEVVLTYQETEDGETYSYEYKNVEDEVLANGEVYHIHTAWPVVDKTVYVTDVTLDPETARLPIGDELQLTATVLPENATDKSVTWNSSDESVAKVDANGKVTAIGEGTATITVTTTDGGHTATCTVTVYRPTPATVSVTGVTLTPDRTRLSIGSKIQLTATVLPEDATDKSVTWSSSNESVAKVDANGLVTAVGTGTATITVTTNDGGHTATCTVIVYRPAPATVYVTGVTLDKTTMDMKPGDTLTLTATVGPANATDKSVTWSSSDESVAKVDANGKVTAVGPGTAIITVTTNDGGHTATCTVTVTEDTVNGGVTDGGWNPDEDVTNGTGNPT